MASTGYLKTQQLPSKFYPYGDTWVKTSINGDVKRFFYPSMMPLVVGAEFIDTNTSIYLHAAAPTEPAGDGSINETDFTGESVVAYSGAPTSYIKSFTSELGIFTSNQDFSSPATSWTIHYIVYYTGTPTPGYTPKMKIEFYKRNSSNADTFLFSKEVGVSILSNECTVNVTPTGTVTTSDRLRIRFYYWEAIPAK